MDPHLSTLPERVLVALCRTAIGLAFLVLIAVVLMQVTTRTLGLYSPVWTEEMARYLLLYMTAFGIGLSLMTGDLVNVDLVQEMMPESVSWWMRLVSAIATALLGAVMIYPAWRFTQIGTFQMSPTLRWPMSFVHASVFVLALTLLLFGLLRVVAMITGKSDGRPELSEDLG
ncbi:TRAP transporter small permease [Tianweitania sp. BSSL-BM11]|uniref:TRAP transporter small permease protein n=1 Tax=Tianweitania aestuarii TaxID=2814886 RepID=A0ABS5RYG4_9HYPH|nr:TRAP transporter small permease [Tianweitania aestuarii]MBS9722080.1 TRAP transporter small permease [Tianweitania aestuarii]